MTFVAQAAIGVVGIILFFGCVIAVMWPFVEGWSTAHAIGAGVGLCGVIGGVALFLRAASHSDDSGPCLHYSYGTSMVMVGKVMVPSQYRYCDQRGEWVK